VKKPGADDEREDLSAALADAKADLETLGRAFDLSRIRVDELCAEVARLNSINELQHETIEQQSRELKSGIGRGDPRGREGDASRGR